MLFYITSMLDWKCASFCYEVEEEKRICLPVFILSRYSFTICQKLCLYVVVVIVDVVVVIIVIFVVYEKRLCTTCAQWIVFYLIKTCAFNNIHTFIRYNISSLSSIQQCMHNLIPIFKIDSSLFANFVKYFDCCVCVLTVAAEEAVAQTICAWFSHIFSQSLLIDW